MPDLRTRRTPWKLQDAPNSPRRQDTPRTVFTLVIRPNPSLATNRNANMKLVQILLPVRDNHGRKFKRALYSKIHKQLVDQFGGLTAHTRSPARGLWNSEGSTRRDDMIILEVMTRRFDRRAGKNIALLWRKRSARTKLSCVRTISLNCRTPRFASLPPPPPGSLAAVMSASVDAIEKDS